VQLTIHSGWTWNGVETTRLAGVESTRSLVALFSSSRRISQVRGDVQALPPRRQEGDAMRSGYAPMEQEVVMEDSRIVAALSTQLAQRIGNQRFELWFGPETRLCVAATRLTIRAASAFVCDWLRRNFTDDLRACWQAIVGQAGTVEFDVDESLAGAAQNGEADAAGEVEQARQAVPAKPQAVDDAATRPVGRQRGESTFAGFVVGASNEYAYRAAELTASGRQQACPVLLWGTTGVGKTHLLWAVQREYRRRHPHTTAVYLTAEQFTTNFVEAIRGSGLPSFRQKCRGSQLLLIDDLQFFAGKLRTLEELQHTVDTLLADGRQLVLASDRSPAELRALGPELASRLAGGLACEIEPPEFATRRGILRRLADEIGLAADDAILAMVATQITAGARELRGALHRLHATCEAFQEPLTRELAERALGELARHHTRTVRLADVQKAVCDVFGVEPAQLRSERKGRAVSEPRMLAMWLARKYTRAAWSEIGAYFGRRSHSTVISAHHRVERLIGAQAQVGLSDRACPVEEAIRKLENALRTA
jgi:chromosomal replication initiator protein